MYFFLFNFCTLQSRQRTDNLKSHVRKCRILKVKASAVLSYKGCTIEMIAMARHIVYSNASNWPHTMWVWDRSIQSILTKPAVSIQTALQSEHTRHPSPHKECTRRRLATKLDPCRPAGDGGLTLTASGTSHTAAGSIRTRRVTSETIASVFLNLSKQKQKTCLRCLSKCSD